MHPKQFGVALGNIDHFLPAQRARVAAEKLVLHVVSHRAKLQRKNFRNAGILVFDQKSLALHKVPSWDVPGGSLRSSPRVDAAERPEGRSALRPGPSLNTGKSRAL